MTNNIGLSGGLKLGRIKKIKNNFMRILYLLTLSLLIFTSCSSSNNDSATVDTKDIKPDAPVITKPTREDTIAFNKLLNNFIIENDEFEKITFYTHKTFGKTWPDRSTITSGVNNTGYAWLRSNYYAEHWLFHKRFQMLIDSNVYDSPILLKNITEALGGKVYEVNTYESPTEILTLISENSDKKITIRFIGREYRDDVVLSDKDKKAINETVQLSLLLKKMQ